MKDRPANSKKPGNTANSSGRDSPAVIQPTAPGAICPACERFTGAALRCPYCGQAARNASSLWILRLSALLLATAGLLFIYLAPSKEAPLIKASSITPMMNFARVRMRGKLERDPYVSHEDGKVGYVSFGLETGDRRVRVKAYRENASDLAQTSRLPKAGDSVEVEGNLRISGAGKVDLVLRSADDVKIRNGF